MAIEIIKTPWSSTFWEGVNDKVDRMSDDLTSSIVLPFLKTGYQHLGNAVAYLAGRIKPKWTSQFLEIWKAPLSFELAIKVANTSKRFLKAIANRKPTETKGLEYFDRSFVSIAQQLYPFVEEASYFLSLPQRLKNFASYFTLDDLFLKLEHIFGRAWKVIMVCVLLIKRLILCILDWIVATVDRIVQFIFQNNSIQIFGYMKSVIKMARQNVKRRFVDVAHEAIDRHAEILRRDALKNIANYSVDYVGLSLGRLAMKTAAVATILTLFPILQLPAVFGICAVAWKAGIKPTLDPYYESFNPQYQIKSSYLEQFCKKFPSIGEHLWKLKLVKTLA